MTQLLLELFTLILHLQAEIKATSLKKFAKPPKLIFINEANAMTQSRIPLQFPFMAMHLQSKYKRTELNSQAKDKHFDSRSRSSRVEF